MPANEREVFEYLTSDETTAYEINLLAYAVFANELQDWISHATLKNSTPPSDQEICEWIANLTEGRYLQMRNEAAGFFDTAAREYLADEIEQAKRSVLDAEILKEVKAGGNFWRQLLIALVTAILAPVIIGLIIAAAIVYSNVFPSIETLSRGLQPSTTQQTPNVPNQ